MPPRSGDATAAISAARSTGRSLRYNRLPSGQWRENRQFITRCKQRRRVDVPEVHGAQWLSRESLTARQGTQAVQRIIYGSGTLHGELERVEPQHVGIARE